MEIRFVGKIINLICEFMELKSIFILKIIFKNVSWILLFYLFIIEL